MKAELISEKDLAEINEWRAKRKVAVLTSDFIPPVGYWVRGLAAGWLFHTDARGLAILDLFVTNPEALENPRRKAIEIVALALLDKAAEAGVKCVIATTHSLTIYNAAKSIGMVDRGASRLLMKEI